MASESSRSDVTAQFLRSFPVFRIVSEGFRNGEMQAKGLN